MEKIISFGHLNIDAADELYIGGKRQKAEIFSIGDSQNNDTDIRWQIQNLRCGSRPGLKSGCRGYGR